MENIFHNKLWAKANRSFTEGKGKMQLVPKRDNTHAKSLLGTQV